MKLSANENKLIIKTLRERYRKSYKLHGNSPKALRWSGNSAQDKRLSELVKDIDFRGKRILDVGCGFGDVLPYIMGKFTNIEYLGVDIMPEFIQTAKDTYNTRTVNEQKNTIKFSVRDIFTKPFKKTFDVVISSGILNSQLKNINTKNIDESKIYGYRKKLIKIMFDHTNEVLAFNMSGNYPQPINKSKNSIYYADSLKILEYCLNLTPKVIFRHNYHDKDFTVIMFK